MADLLLLQPDPRAAGALRGALESRYTLRSVESWADLTVALDRDPPLGCILDIFHVSPPIQLADLRSVRREHPAVALIVYSDFSGREMELYHLGRLDVAGVLRMEENPGPRRFRRVVASSLATCLADMVVESVARDSPPFAREVIRWGIEHAESGPRVSDLAAAMDLPPRTCLRRTRTLNLPTPRKLLLWCRLIHAAHLLERPGLTVEDVAFRLGYSTGGALRKVMRRHMECSPTCLRRKGGLAFALEMMQRKVLHRGGRWEEGITHPSGD